MEKLPGLKWYPIFGTTYVFKGVKRAGKLKHYKILPHAKFCEFDRCLV